MQLLVIFNPPHIHMRNYILVILAILLSLLSIENTLMSQEWEGTCCTPYVSPPQKFYIGPEYLHVRRTRDGGTKQNGNLYGFRGGYERIKNWGIYWGVEGHWAQGCLTGHSGGHDRLKSTFTDSHVEGRLGYTFQIQRWCQPSITPFAGVGYFWEQNRFRSPSPLHLQFLTRAPYGLLGFLTNVELPRQFAIGLNFKACFMYDAKCEVSRDPEFGRTTLKIGDKINYRLELPLTYHFCIPCNAFDVALVPFYESRHYGQKLSFPFAFQETKLRIYGVNLQFIYRL